MDWKCSWHREHALKNLILSPSAFESEQKRFGYHFQTAGKERREWKRARRGRRSSSDRGRGVGGAVVQAKAERSSFNSGLQLLRALPAQRCPLQQMQSSQTQYLTVISGCWRSRDASGFEDGCSKAEGSGDSRKHICSSFSLQIKTVLSNKCSGNSMCTANI